MKTKVGQVSASIAQWVVEMRMGNPSLVQRSKGFPLEAQVELYG
jgi:hypothetical protein